MNILLSYTIIHYFVTTCISIPTNITNVQNLPINTTNSSNTDVLVSKIKELEQQKDKLFSEINKAMEESVVALVKSNVTNAEQGVNYIEDLKRQIQNIAISNSEEDEYDEYGEDYVTTAAYDITNSIVEDTRRKNGKHGKHNKKPKITGRVGIKDLKEFARIDTQLESVAGKPGVREPRWNLTSNIKRGDQKFLEKAEREIDKMLNKGLSGQRLKDRLARRQKMKEQLDEWVRMRFEERKKIKEYKAMLLRKYGKLEKCPRHGLGPHFKLLSLEHTTLPNARFPCCRKCCKNSYLGCLK